MFRGGESGVGKQNGNVETVDTTVALDIKKGPERAEESNVGDE